MENLATKFLFPVFPDGYILTEKESENMIDVISKVIDLKDYINRRKKEIREDPMWQFGRANFQNDDGTPWEMSPGELAIYRAIVLREYPRLEIITSTQYGKTLTISRGCLTRITSFPDEFLILAPDLKRGQIIIDYMIRDTANNEDFTAMLMGIDLKQKNMLMRLLEERSKVKLTYQQPTEKNEPLQYGSVEILSVQAKRRNQAITGVMGFGGRNLICDESALTDDEINAGVFRMMAGKGEDTFWVKIGNPFFRNHFLDDWKDPTFAKIYVDYLIAMLEGRYTETFIKKAMTLPRAEVLYECRFPKAGAIDSKGWIPLLTEEEIKAAMVKLEPGTNAHFGEERTGNDPADEGENEAVIVKRSAGYAEILYAEAGLDSFQFAGPVMDHGTKINSRKIYIDKIGVGAATLGKANEVNKMNPDEKTKAKITGVNVGETARDPARFFNIRAEIYWRVREWIKQGGRLSYDTGWLQLAKIKYTATTGGKLQIMSKKDMRALNIVSPDKADALALTFYDPPVAAVMSADEKFFAKKMAEKNRRIATGIRMGLNTRPR